MGYDPYWPACLATINTTIVPAATLPPRRFDEIYEALSQQRCTPLSEISDDQINRNDLVNSSNYRQGSIFFDFGRFTADVGAQALEYEPNSRTQLLIGIYDSSRNTDGSDTGLEAAQQNLQTFASARHRDVVCILLAVGLDETESRDSVAVIRDLSQENVEYALRFAYAAWSKHVCHLADNLSAAKLHGSAATDTSNGEVNGTVGDMVQDTGKRRYTIVLGLLNLYTGAWTDALRRLSEGITLAREAGDPMWQARALEALVLCMGLLVWQGTSFDVPRVCEQAYSTSQLMSKTSIFARTNSMIASPQSKPDTTLTSVQKWLKYAPVLMEAVLGVYDHVATSPQETVSLVVVTQSRIRALNLLVLATQAHESTLIDDFDNFFLHRSLPSPAGGSPMGIGVNIAAQVSAALPASDKPLVTSDGIAATLAAVSCLSATGSHRRQAFMLRGLLQRLVPALNKARTIGASEAGIHPSSTSAAEVKGRSTSMEAGLRALAKTTAGAYGAFVSSDDVAGDSPYLSKSRIEQNLVRWCDEHTEGDLPLKTDILLLCVAICESIGDTVGAADLISALMRLAIMSPVVSQVADAPKLLLTTGEQTRALDRIKRWTEKADRGLATTGALYWDDFLVRDIQVTQNGNRSALLSHAPSELSLVDDASKSQARDPFIFNPFARNTTVQAAPVVVAGEMVVFSVQLQNPLEVPVDVSDIRLAVEGCAFVPTRHSVVLGASSSQIFTLTGKPVEAGSLKVLGCEATIEGCRRQIFPTMKANWQPPLKTKQQMNRPRALEGRAKHSREDVKVADPQVLNLTVIHHQPDLEIVSTSLTQPSLMLLEGERRVFSLSIKNASDDVSSDLLLLTSNDNISRGLRESLTRKDLLPVDTYEVQHQLKYGQPLQIGALAPQQTQIEPSETKEYSVEIFGRPGLSEASVHVDFAHLGQPQADIKQTFYTRQIRYPLALTVNGSIEVVRCNVLSIHGELPTFEGVSTVANGEKLHDKGWSSAPDGVCMLSLDLRNVWPQPLTVELHSRFNLESNTDAGQNSYTTSEAIQPGHVSRVILVIPRLFVQDPLAPIPNLDTSRQFVVNSSKMSPEAEAAVRQNFWYREELLKHISGTWTEVKSGRQGEIDLRKGIRLNLNARMIDVLRVEHIDISYSLIAQSEEETASTLRTLDDAHYQLQTESFATLRVTVRNRSTERLPLLLRLQPSLRDQPHNIALDLSRRLSWSGVLQQVLHPPLKPGDVREIDLGLLVLAAGSYEVNATVEEVKPRSKTRPPGTDTLGLGANRRIWHARTPCLIDALEVIE